MKKVYFLYIPLILIICIAGSNLLPKGLTKKFDADKGNFSKENQNNNLTHVESDFTNQTLTCKSCHETEYPTKNDPGLRKCPRFDMISKFPTFNKGPEVVDIKEMSDKYTDVVFSHKIHSQMSEMSIGCTDCHHYNTTGPVLNCRECHEQNRSREDVSVPDLKAAFHRQCMGCHKQWSHDNGCSTQCHSNKGTDVKNRDRQEMLDKKHPKVTEPTKMIWETNSAAGKIVTFFHNEHNQLFKINCNTCHKQENCTKCHDVNNPKDDKNPIGIKKSFEDHHKPCMNCHNENACEKCHKEKEMTPFNHSSSAGWTLKNYHSRLACEKCHGNSMPFKKLDNNCTSCHKNFAPGKFDHKLAGLTLSENHKEMECENCHLKNDFSKPPDCKTCHDDKSFPAQSPGKR